MIPGVSTKVSGGRGLVVLYTVDTRTNLTDAECLQLAKNLVNATDGFIWNNPAMESWANPESLPKEDI